MPNKGNWEKARENLFSVGAETGMKICDTTDPIHTIQPHEADKVKRKLHH